MAEPKKQVPLRLNAKLYDALAAWAEDDFRSVNGQIEYLLTECVRQRKRTASMSRTRLMCRLNWISNKIPIGPGCADELCMAGVCVYLWLPKG